MILVINLSHRNDRRQHIVRQFMNMGIDDYFFVEGVNGKKKFPDVKRANLQGHFGCLESHKKVLNMFTTLEYEWCIVMEDDCVLDREWTTAILNDVPSDVELVYFGGNKTLSKKPIEPFNEKFDKAIEVYCTHAYAIRKASIPALLNVLNSRMWKVDVLFTEFQQSHKCLITRKCYAWQLNSLSDITGVNLQGDKLKYLS